MPSALPAPVGAGGRPVRQNWAGFPHSAGKEGVDTCEGSLQPMNGCPAAPRRKVASGDGSPAPPPPSVALQASILVLNRLYMAVHVIGVRRAFAPAVPGIGRSDPPRRGSFANYTFDSWREMCSLRASCKQPHEDWIRAVNFEIQVPRVIRLLTYDRLPKQGLHLNRRNVLARDGHSCQYCGRHFPIHQLSLDHVVPRSRGGTTTWENVVCACLACNVTQGRPHPARGQDEARPPPSETQAESLARPEAGQPQVRKLADLAGRRLLGYRGKGLRERDLGSEMSSNKPTDCVRGSAGSLRSRKRPTSRIPRFPLLSYFPRSFFRLIIGSFGACWAFSSM